MTTLEFYHELKLTARVSHYRPEVKSRSFLDPDDPEELEFEVYLPCGHKLELDEDEATDVAESIRAELREWERKQRDELRLARAL